MANLRVDKITSTETFETTGSVQFHQDNNNYLSGTITAIGTQDFTIECWVYLIKVRSAENQSQRIFGNEDYQFDSNTVNMRFTPNTTIEMYYGATGNVTSDTLSESTWYHIAMSYSDNIARCYVDGKEFGRIHGNNDLGNTTMFIGGTYTVGGENFNGFVSNARLIVGKGIYPENFKPPMRELEVTPETVLLACQSKTDKLEERSGNTTLSATGSLHSASELTPGLLTPVPKAGAGSAITGSVEFDGTGDYLELANNEDFQFGTDDWSIEFWWNGQPTGSYTAIITTLVSSNEAGTWRVGTRFNSTNKIYFARGTGSSFTDVQFDVDVNDGYWHHIAFVRSSGTIIPFVDGVDRTADLSNGSVSDSNSMTTTNPVKIGFNSRDSAYVNGFISNLRVVKGTALYTDSFIPPTRELKKVPGTVLLCCQDPDSPLTEATGKTIVGYGDLQNGPGVNFVKNGDFSDGTTNWVADSGANISATGGVATITNGGGDNLYAIKQEDVLVIGKRYRFTGTIVPTFSSGTANFRVRAGGSAVSYATTTLTNGETFNFDTGEVVADGANLEIGSGTSSDMTQFTLTNVYGETLDSTEASNFTPQVGDDRKVTFEGVTKVNSDVYFYLPTGDTVTRDSRSGRGIFMGGYTTSPSNAAVGDIHYINIPSMGNSFEFGDLVNAARWAGGSCGSSTRGLYGGGATPTSTDHIDFVTIATTSDALDFGDLDTAQGYVKACSNQTRGIWGGGRSNNSPVVSSDVIQYITIASKGDAIDFGNLTSARTATGNTASPVRALFGGGYTSPSSADTNIIDFVSIQSTGNAVDFGDLIEGVNYSDAASNGIRGVWGGGNPSPAGDTNRIQYVNIASTGNAQDFGDLSQSAEHISCTDNSIRGVWGGGVTPTYLNVLQYVTIATTGNAKDFGDLSRPNLGYAGGTSDSHGGLG